MIDEFNLGKHSALSVAISECSHVKLKLKHLQLFAFHKGNFDKVEKAIDSVIEACEELDIELSCCEKEIRNIITKQENDNEN